jgi:ATP-dependent Clp protease protease subunit
LTDAGPRRELAAVDPLEEIEQIIMPNHSMHDRIVFLSGDVNEHSITSVIEQLLVLANQSPRPIHLVVSTYGGSVDEMFSLYDTIKFLPCPVHTVGLGKVMSAGVLLLASGVKGKRQLGRSARIMIHPVSGGVVGNVFEMMNEVAESQRLQSLMVDALVSESKMTKEQVMKLMKSGCDNYLTPIEAVKLGIVDLDRLIGTS